MGGRLASNFMSHAPTRVLGTADAKHVLVEGSHRVPAGAALQASMRHFSGSQQVWELPSSSSSAGMLDWCHRQEHRICLCGRAAGQGPLQLLCCSLKASEHAQRMNLASLQHLQKCVRGVIMRWELQMTTLHLTQRSWGTPWRRDVLQPHSAAFQAAACCHSPESGSQRSASASAGQHSMDFLFIISQSAFAGQHIAWTLCIISQSKDQHAKGIRAQLPTGCKAWMSHAPS